MFRNIFAGRKKKSIIIITLIMLMVGVYTVYSYFDNKEAEKYLATYGEVSQTLSKANSKMVSYFKLDELYYAVNVNIKEELVEQKTIIDKATATFAETKVHKKYKQQHADMIELLRKESDLLDKAIVVVGDPAEARQRDLFTNINDDIYALKLLAADSKVPSTRMPSFNELDKIIEPLYMYINYSELTKTLNESFTLLANDIRLMNLYDDKKRDDLKEKMHKEKDILEHEAKSLMDVKIEDNYQEQRANIIAFIKKECHLLDKIIFALANLPEARNTEFLKQIHDYMHSMQDLAGGIGILGVREIPSRNVMDYSIKILGMYIHDKHLNSADTKFVEKWKKLKGQSYNGDINILITGGGINYNTYIARDSVVVKEINPRFVVLGCKMMFGTKDLANDKTSWSDKEFKYDLKNKGMYFIDQDGKLKCLTSGKIATSLSYDSCMRSASEIAYYLAFGKNFLSNMDQSYLLLKGE